MPSLVGPQTKIERARHHIESGEASVKGWFESHPYLITPCEFDSEAGAYNVRVQYFQPLPATYMAVVVGEIAHDLRSALDQLACQLAVRINPTVDQSSTGFPVALRGPRAKRLKGQQDDRFSRERLSKTLRGYVTRVEGFQPYKRRNGGSAGPLWMLHELNNFDKHRDIPLTTVSAGAVSIRPRIGAGMVTVGRMSITAGVPLVNGAKVGSVDDPDVQMQFSVTPQIRFGEGCPSDLTGKPLFPTLRKMSDEVARIVESFASEF